MSNHGLKCKTGLNFDRQFRIMNAFYNILVKSCKVLKEAVINFSPLDYIMCSLTNLFIGEIQVTEVLCDITSLCSQKRERTFELWDDVSDEERLHHSSNWRLLSQNLIGQATNHRQSAILFTSVSLLNRCLQILIQNAVDERQNTHECVLLTISCKIDEQVDCICLRGMEILQRI
jgi:hypothetical protein